MTILPTLLSEISHNDRFRSSLGELDLFDMGQHPYGWLSLVPPVVAILLAILTRRILISLFVAILSGALILTFHQGSVTAEPTPDALGGWLPGSVIDVWHAVSHGVADAWNDHLWPALIDADKISVFVFTCLMGAIVGMVNRAAGMRGLLHLISPLTGSIRRTQLAAWFSGMLVFFDDYANTMLLGTTFRSMFDRLKISREKLAYIVDSTAAPVAGLAIVSTWIAGELQYIDEGTKVAFAGGTETNAFGLFLQSIPYRFYVLWALFFVVLIAITKRDFGPMLKAEVRARRSQQHSDQASEFLMPSLDWDSMRLSQQNLDSSTVEALAVASDPTLAPSGTRSRSLNAIVPILVTVAAILGFMYQTGLEAAGPLPDQPAVAAAATSDAANAAPDSEPAATPSRAWAVTIWLGKVFGEANSYNSLVWGSLIGFFFTLLWLAAQRIVPFPALTHAAGNGAAQMVPALMVLWLASTLSAMTAGSQNPSPEYAGQRDQAQVMANAIAGVDETPHFETLNEAQRVHETLHLNHLDRTVIVETLAPAYTDPEAFLREVTDQVTMQPDGSFYARYLFQNGKQVDWDKVVKPAELPVATPEQAAVPQVSEPGAEAAQGPGTGGRGGFPGGRGFGPPRGPARDAQQSDQNNSRQVPSFDPPPRPVPAATGSSSGGSGAVGEGRPEGQARRPQAAGTQGAGPQSARPQGAGGRPAGGAPPAGGGNRSMAGMFAGQGPAEPDLRESWNPDATAGLSFPFADFRHRLHTGNYLSSLLTRRADSVAAPTTTHPLTPWLPTIIFVLAGITAFATGSSWGTMGIVMPLAIPLAVSLLSNGGTVSGAEVAGSGIFLATIGSVLAGAVFGDHCSPISDTTVLSSQASGCDHLAHVWTQMPYALAVGLVTILFGTIPVGFGFPWWLCLSVGTVALVIIVMFMGRTVEQVLEQQDSSTSAT